jgi:apolipoprotein D and lipocalin family protein
VVPTVDLERYAGRWFEVARLPNRFQKKCVGDVTATYSLMRDGRIEVVNRCRDAGGAVTAAKGVARRVDGQPPSILQVRFAPAVLGFLPGVWGDYQIIALDAGYGHAMIGTPDRKYLWVLSRTPRLDEQVYRSLLDQAKAQGFDVSKVEVTSQRPR